MTETTMTTQATRYWRSLEQLEGSAEFRELAAREFPEGADQLDGVDRRRFLQLMGASTALAGAASCRWEKAPILPFVESPEGRIPGVPAHYATALELSGVAQSLVVASYEGRPVKVDGNDVESGSRGAATTLAQSAILELYDPDRSRAVVRGGAEQAGWASFDAWLETELARLAGNAGRGLAVVHEPTSSPSAARLLAALRNRFPEATVVAYTPAHRDHERAGAVLAFGTATRTHYRLEQARVLACFDSDLLCGHPDHLRHARAFAAQRQPDRGELSRLYAVEARFTTTGSLADHRLPLRSESVGACLAALEAALVAKGAATPAGFGTASATPGGELIGGERVRRFVDALADDLLAHRGACLVAVGPQQPPAIHALAHRINAALGAVGTTVLYTDEPLGEAAHGPAALAPLVEGLRARRLETVFVLGGNPAYDAPADLQLAEALGQAQQVVRLGLYQDETSARAQWHLPQAHFLESWGDSRAFDGTLCVTQPLIRPLYDGRSPFELLARLAGATYADPQELVRTTFGNDEARTAAWRQALHDGVARGTGYAPVARTARPLPALAFPPSALAAGIPANGQLELILYPDAKVHDGRFANSGWLQELPEFMTKLTWDNAALIGPATAQALGVKHEQLVQLAIGGRQLECVVYVMPGQAAGSVALALGYGRTHAGHVGGLVDADVPTVGFDSYRLLDSRAGLVATGLTVTGTGRSYLLSCTQDHHQIDTAGLVEREVRIDELARHQTAAQHAEHPTAMQDALLGVHYPPLKSLWKEFEYSGHRWGMSIDLSTCTGCNACVVACQAENNIPIVGKEQVRRGREMHWLRIDRYFETGAAPEREYTGGHGDHGGGEHGTGEHGDDHAAAAHGPADQGHGDHGHDAHGHAAELPRPHGVLDEENPRIHRQPVACIQCELAPCEQVCPVAATVHTDEGLNDMVYNRCIGTRYCSNNCPVKVRRFNFFNYHKDLKDPRNEVSKMAFNPEVTVRARGVMEKCTYCVQRIQTVKIAARNQKRPIRDGEIVTACQQTCPTDAIVFGDLSDPASRVAQAHQNARNYALLGYLNIKPRTTYLTRITNPNPALA
jgi:MoCo/4Fe-4S cofactor protein with predicted Tat translocation signal